MWLATALTLAYAGIEAGVGGWAGSLALVADAGHMVNDAAALSLAAVAAWLAHRPASARHSYGFGRAEFLAALVNSLALLMLVLWLAVSAVQRLHSPQPVSGEAVSLVAAIGLGVLALCAGAAFLWKWDGIAPQVVGWEAWFFVALGLVTAALMAAASYGANRSATI